MVSLARAALQAQPRAAGVGAGHPCTPLQAGGRARPRARAHARRPCPPAPSASVQGPVRPDPPPRPAAAPPPPPPSPLPTSFPFPGALPSSASSSSPDPRFALIRIPGDGSCLFRALAQGNHALGNGGALLDRTGLLTAGFDLRRSICAVLTARRSSIEPFLDCPFPAYIESMSLEGTWGGEPELAAAPAALRRPVCVYEATARGPLGGVAALRKVSAYGVDRFPDTPPVCVLFSGAHYDLLLQE